MRRIEKERGVLVVKLDAVEMPMQRDNSIVAKVSSEVPALANAVNADGEIDVLAIELLGFDEQMRLARFSIPKEGEETFEKITLGSDICDGPRAIFFVGRAVVLSICGRAQNEAC